MNTLNQFSLLTVRGDDAASFLQGQFTNDVDKLDSGWQFSGYCNPKGRLLGLFYLWRVDGAFYALTSQQLSDSLIARLRMFVLRSKVVIEKLDKAPIEALFELPSDPLVNLAQFDRFRLSIQDDTMTLGFGTHALRIYPQGQNSTKGKNTGYDERWTDANINAGIPSVDANTTELFVPQMLNLDLLDGISFKKGCYTGQEIVARMHYLGKLKQRMYVCEAQSKGEFRLDSGQKVVTKDNRNVGNLVTPAVNNRCLAVLRTELIEDTLVTEQSVKLIVLQSQPYPLTIPT